MKKLNKINTTLSHFKNNLISIEFIPNFNMKFMFPRNWGFTNYLNNNKIDWLKVQLINDTDSLQLFTFEIIKNDKNIDDVLNYIDVFLTPFYVELKKQEKIDFLIQKELEKSQRKIELERKKAEEKINKIKNNVVKKDSDED